MVFHKPAAIVLPGHVTALTHRMLQLKHLPRTSLLCRHTLPDRMQAGFHSFRSHTALLQYALMRRIAIYALQNPGDRVLRWTLLVTYEDSEQFQLSCDREVFFTGLIYLNLLTALSEDRFGCLAHDRYCTYQLLLSCPSG